MDRVLCSAHAHLKWQDAVVNHLPFFSSDHVSLYMQLSPEVKRDPSRRPFRFEAAWLKHDGFKELLQNSWKTDVSTPNALSGLRRTLQKWNREVFGMVQQKKEKLVTDIKAVQDLIELAPTDVMLTKEADLITELDGVLEQEEVLWFQKS